MCGILCVIGPCGSKQLHELLSKEIVVPVCLKKVSLGFKSSLFVLKQGFQQMYEVCCSGLTHTHTSQVG